MERAKELYEVIRGMPIAADFTPEASSVRCLFRSVPIEQEVSQAFP